MGNLPETIAAAAFFGLLFISPLVMLFLRHQRQMAEIMRRGAPEETNQRMAALEYEVRELRSTLNEQLIRRDDERELAQRGSK